MIAIFYTEQESIDFSNDVHSFLERNRRFYRSLTDLWSDVNKSDNEEKWAVPLPEDYDDYEEKLNLDGLEFIDKLPDNWRNIEEL